MFLLANLLFCNNIIEIKYEVKTIENVLHDEITTNLSINFENQSKNIKMWGNVFELDSDYLNQLENLPSKPIFGIISWYEGKGNILVFIKKNEELIAIKRNVFENESEYISEEEEIKSNNDLEVFSLNISEKSQIKFKKISQNKSYILDKNFLIIASTKTYQEALYIAKEAQRRLNKSINFENYEYFKEVGLINNNFVYSQHMYYPRGLNDDGDYISIEYSSFYEKFTPNLFLVIVSSGDYNLLSKELLKIKELYKDAYIKKN